MESSNLDGHKLTQHPIEVAKWLSAGDTWEGVKTLYPVYVEISPFGGCNFRCSFCAVDALKYRPLKIEPDLLRSTLSVMAEKGVKSVMIAGEGEPLLYDELGSIFAHAAKVGIDTALATNASISNFESLESAARNCAWIRASVNAGDAKTHSEIHRCREDVFERVFSNLEFMVGKRNDFKSRTTLGAQAVLVETNRDSMLELAKRSREIGLDYLTVKPYSQGLDSSNRDHEHTNYDFAPELAKELREIETDRFKVHFRYNAFAKAKVKTHSYSRCHSVPNFWAYVKSNGDVMGCGAFLTGEKFKYGNINEMSFDGIWEGEGRRQAHEYMRTHDIGQCRVNCRMDKVNEYLWSLKNPAPHVNFI
jgi:GTP 3',8-cyclase